MYVPHYTICIQCTHFSQNVHVNKVNRLSSTNISNFINNNIKAPSYLGETTIVSIWSRMVSTQTTIQVYKDSPISRYPPHIGSLMVSPKCAMLVIIERYPQIQHCCQPMLVCYRIFSFFDTIRVSILRILHSLIPLGYRYLMVFLFWILFGSINHARNLHT